MKRLINLMAIAVATVMAFGCTEGIQTNLSVVSTELEAPAEGVVLPIKFNASAAWTAESDQDWVTLSKTSGDAGEAQVEATVAANDTYEDRTANVTIKAADKEVKYTIVQKMLTSFDAEFVYEISAEAQEITFAMESNVDYEFTISEDAKSWISTTATKAAPAESEKVFKVKANAELKPREGIIVVKAGNAVFGMIVKQFAQFENLPEAAAACLGRTQRIYDPVNWTYYNFTEYTVTLKDETTQVTLALNMAPDADITAVPEGTFLVDATGTHAEGTFSIKPLDGFETIYTNIVENGNETLIEDGEITIAKDGDAYVISAVLLDNRENEHRYSFIGEIASVEDKTLGAYISGVTFYGQYETYFTTKANSWSFSMYMSKAAGDGVKSMNSTSFTIFGAKGDVSADELPTGTFTFNAGEKDSAVTYASGNYKYDTGSLSSLSFNENDGEIYWTAGEGSTVTISKNEDGTYNIAFDAKISYDEYDDNYNKVGTVTSDYKASFENVRTNYTEMGFGQNPAPDGNVELESIMGSYSGLYVGNKDTFAALANPLVWSENSSLLIIGATVAYSTDKNSYAFYIALNAPEYEFVKDFRDRYCTTPPASQKYEFSRDATQSGVLLPVLFGNNSYSYVKNSYTGTTMPIVGGSVTINGASITFDLEVECKPDNTTYKVTGTTPFTYQFAQDWTKNAKSFSVVPAPAN